VKVVVSLAETPAQREACYALRYRVFVEELEQNPPLADHERRLEMNGDDAKAVLMLARADGAVVGTLRLHHGAEQGIPPFVAKACEPAMRDRSRPPDETAAITRLAIERRYRGGPALVALVRACFEYLTSGGRATSRVLILSLDTPGHHALYRLLGFRAVDPVVRYTTDVGVCVPMVADLPRV